MSKAELEEWGQRYATQTYAARQGPSPLLTTWLGQLAQGRALDLACGYGRNAQFLTQHGYQVDAIDISRYALIQAQHRATCMGLHINWIQADLDQFCLPQGFYQVVVNSFYLNRGLAPSIAGALAPGGILLFEYHLQTSQPVDGPQGGKYRLQPGELPALFPYLLPLHYEESMVNEEGRVNAVARLVARRVGNLPLSQPPLSGLGYILGGDVGA